MYDVGVWEDVRLFKRLCRSHWCIIIVGSWCSSDSVLQLESRKGGVAILAIFTIVQWRAFIHFSCPFSPLADKKMQKWKATYKELQYYFLKLSIHCYTLINLQGSQNKILQSNTSIHQETNRQYQPCQLTVIISCNYQH